MSDIFSIISANYSAAGSVTYSSTKYVPVNPSDYQGTWTGKFGDSSSFSVNISNVQGFRAVVSYRSGGTVNYSQVLIKDGSFRIGDSKFVLQGSDTALMAEAVTDPVTGAVSVKQGYASRS